MKPRFDPRRGCVWSGTPPGEPSEGGLTSSGAVSTPSWSLGSLVWRPKAGRFDQGIDGIRCCQSPSRRVGGRRGEGSRVPPRVAVAYVCWCCSYAHAYRVASSRKGLS